MSDDSAVADDEVDDTLRHPCVVEDLRQKDGADRRILTRLQDRRASGGKRVGELHGRCLDWPIPRRDQSAHSDRFAPNERVSYSPLELIIAQRDDRLLEMVDRPHDLHRRADGCSHLFGNCRPQIRDPLFIGANNALKQRYALSLRCRAELRKCASRSRNGTIDVGRAAHGDRCERFLRCRVDQLKPVATRGLNPISVDVEFAILAH